MVNKRDTYYTHIQTKLFIKKCFQVDSIDEGLSSKLKNIWPLWLLFAISLLFQVLKTKH